MLSMVPVLRRLLLHAGPVRDNVIETLGGCCQAPRWQPVDIPGCGGDRLRQNESGFTLSLYSKTGILPLIQGKSSPYLQNRSAEQAINTA